MKPELYPSMNIRLSMDESSLAPFRAAWKAAGRSNGLDAIDIARAAYMHHAELRSQSVAPFLRTHLHTIPRIAHMLSDAQWRIDSSARDSLVAALSYFADTADLIPDTQSRFGLLDDAIVVELALADHAEEWQAWLEFNECREMFEAGTVMDRNDWFEHARVDIEKLLKHRRSANHGSYAPLPALTEFALN